MLKKGNWYSAFLSRRSKIFPFIPMTTLRKFCNHAWSDSLKGSVTAAVPRKSWEPYQLAKRVYIKFSDTGTLLLLLFCFIAAKHIFRFAVIVRENWEAKTPICLLFYGNESLLRFKGVPDTDTPHLHDLLALLEAMFGASSNLPFTISKAIERFLFDLGEYWC